jgi:methylenetetrahydrofolate reductase (NADPH)
MTASARPVSIEVFPPRTAPGRERLEAELGALASLAPAWISVTCPAGPGARERTYETVAWLRERLGPLADIVPHVIGVGATRPSVGQLLSRYRALGVRRLVVVRGDVTPGGAEPPGDFPHARDLIEFVRAETGRAFHVQAAAHPEVHPEAPGAESDLEQFARKLAAGADSAITQYFYNVDAYFAFVDACARRGLTAPIVPGIMPITDYPRLVRFSAAAGVEIPRWLRMRLDELAAQPEALTAFGVEVVSRLCERLLAGGAPALHFYTMNRAEPVVTICRRLALPPAVARLLSPS